MKKKEKSIGELSAKEIKTAEITMITILQREAFLDERKNLLANKEIPKNSKIIRLCPVMKNGILRVGGRLQNAELDIDQTHPILIPKQHPITTLMIRDTHISL